MFQLEFQIYCQCHSNRAGDLSNALKGGIIVMMWQSSAQQQSSHFVSLYIVSLGLTILRSFDRSNMSKKRSAIWGRQRRSMFLSLSCMYVKRQNDLRISKHSEVRFCDVIKNSETFYLDPRIRLVGGVSQQFELFPQGGDSIDFVLKRLSQLQNGVLQISDRVCVRSASRIASLHLVLNGRF